jgi:hypothetical protein
MGICYQEAWEYVERCMRILPNEYCQKKITRCENLVLYHMGLQRHEKSVTWGCRGMRISVQKQTLHQYTPVYVSAFTAYKLTDISDSTIRNIYFGKRVPK